MKTASIEFRNIVKRYGDPGTTNAVNGISFTVPKGTLTTILGPSGCGKTTTLRMIAGLEFPTSGQILINGQDVSAVGPSSRPVSMVFQGYALFPHMTVLGNVCYGLSVTGVDRTERVRRARECMSLVGLTGYDDRLPSELSGGQQQRVAVARALVLEPAVLLFDEPLSNLDARLRRSMREEIRALQQRLGLTVAYVTHDQGEALAVSDQIIVMNSGKIAQVGTSLELYERPASEFVANFMGEAAVFTGQAQGDGSVRVGPLRVSTQQQVEAGTVRMAVRPEAWQISSAPGSGLEGTVSKHAYLGNCQEMTIETTLGPIFVTSTDRKKRWSRGEVVSLDLGAEGTAILP